MWHKYWLPKKNPTDSHTKFQTEYTHDGYKIQCQVQKPSQICVYTMCVWKKYLYAEWWIQISILNQLHNLIEPHRGSYAFIQVFCPLLLRSV